MIRPQDILPRGEGSLLDADTVDGLHARDILQKVRIPSWTEIPGLPKEFPPAPHTHELAKHGASHWSRDQDPVLPENIQGALSAAENPSRDNPYVTRTSVARVFSFSDSREWAIPHNLGRYPLIRVFTAGRVEVEADVVHVSNNLALVRFEVPMSGSAVVA